MVVFACSACGESLKKNQVESHYLRNCRNCNMLSCLDCGKDFWGNEYEQHTKCITEEEKYSGKNFVPKASSNKNENKQQQWLQQVQEAVNKCRTNPRLKSVLNRLKDQPNVPRKKSKFLNFLANGYNVRDSYMAEQVWEVLMVNAENKQQENDQSNNNKSNINYKTDNHSVNEKTSENNVCHSNGVGDENKNDEEEKEEGSKKLSKREKKEERRKKAHKTEKKDKSKVNEVEESDQVNGDSDVKTKKKTKRKDAEDFADNNKKSKKRKREDEQEGEGAGKVDEESGDQSMLEEDGEEPAQKKFKTKFNWNEVIVEVLQTKGPEMKVKKLRKKILAEYLSQGCTEKSEEKLWARFEKKLRKIPEIKVLGEKVKLKTNS